MEETIKRLGALAFAAVYLHKHGSERAPALRVAHSAYRFLDGEDADLINQEADAAIAARETGAKPKRKKLPVKAHIKSLRRLINHGR